MAGAYTGGVNEILNQVFNLYMKVFKKYSIVALWYDLIYFETNIISDKQATLTDVLLIIYGTSYY